MADQKVLIEIVLDDGSVKKGFASIKTEAKKAGDEVEKSLGKGNAVEGLADGLSTAASGFSAIAARAAVAIGPMGALALAVGAVADGFRRAALAGEQANAVNVQFANLATSAGLAADQFSDAIIRSTQGLIDDEDALQIASKAIVALGENAAKIPAILDASRNVSRALGKDFKDTFEGLSSFVETGNARVLRQFGIVLDLERAYAAAAKSIGLTAAALTEQQKQQIRTNLLLDEVPKKFGAAADSVTPLQDALTRLQVRAGNVFEELSKNVSNFITRAFIDESDLSNVGVTRLRDRYKEVGEEIKNLEATVNRLNANIANGSATASASLQVNRLREELKALNEERDKLLIEQSGRSDQELFRQLEASRNQPAAAPQITATAEQRAAVLAEQNKIALESQKVFNAQLLALDNEFQTQKLNNQLTNATIEETERLRVEEAERQHKLRLEQIDKDFRSRLGISDTEFNKIKETAEQLHQQKLTSIKAEADKARLKLDTENKAKQLDATRTALGQIATLQTNASGELAQIGKAAAITQATIDGYLAVQNAFANVPYPFNFAAAALVGAATAANVAKIASTGPATVSSSYNPNTGSAGNPFNPDSNITDTVPTEAARVADTQIQININGDVLDSEESGLRIVNLLNDAFDKKGVVVRRGALA